MATQWPVMDEGISDIDAGWTLDPSTIPDFNMGDDSWFDSIWDFISGDTAKALWSLGSGAYGLYESNQLKQMAKNAYGASDPFGSQRPMYAAALANLMKNPASITEDPAYKFQRDQGEEAVVRQMAAKGYLGSGNMGTALIKYSGDFATGYYNDRIKTLAELAGAGIAPNFNSAISGYASGIDTASKSLASIGYGTTIAGGSGQSRPNSAGGEAAQIGGLAKTTGSVLNKTGNKTAGGYVSGVGDIISGISQGGAKGYGQALSGASNIAELAGYGGTTTSGVGAAGNLASGNYVGAAKDLYGIYTGAGGALTAGAATGAASTGIATGVSAGVGEAVGAGAAGALTGTTASTGAATGSLAGTGGGAAAAGGALAAAGLFAVAWAVADAVNAKGDLRSGTVTSIVDQMVKNQGWTLANPKNQTYKLPDGRFIQVGKKAQKVADALINGDQSVAESAYQEWLSSANTDYKTAVRGGS